MREERLLERISSWEIGSERTNLTSVDILIGSILRHLRGILNTQRGTVPIDKEYGLPDFSNLAPSFSSGSTKEIQDDLIAGVDRDGSRRNGFLGAQIRGHWGHSSQ